MQAAGDAANAAVAVASVVAADLGYVGAPEVLHQSNNVVVRFDGVVVKVGVVGSTAMEREVALAAEGAARGAPVLAPLCHVIVRGRWLVSVWPFVERVGTPSPASVAAALRAFHDAMRATTVELPTLGATLRHSSELARDRTALSATDEQSRQLLSRALVEVADRTELAATVVVHGEPHDGNLIPRERDVVLIDLESTKRAPVEWDLAVRPADEVATHWPDADQDLVDLLRVGVSAQVSTYCWRHVSARPGDDDIRWHAEHHLKRVAAAHL